MPAFLSDAWFARFRELAGALPERPGVSARLQYQITGGPEGEVRYHLEVRDGRLITAELGDDPGAALTLSASWADALATARGELDAAAAYMQGRLKATDAGVLVDLMPMVQSEEYRALEAAMAAELET